MILRLTIKLLTLAMVIALTACASPKRGEAEFAPTMPEPVRSKNYDSSSIYQSSTAWLLHEDMKAHRIGDMITVTLEEKTDAEKSAETGIAKSGSVTMPDPTIFGGVVTAHGRAILDNSLESELAFDGSGDSSQSNSLMGSITVTVVDVLSNGNLMVRGEKWIKINQGEEYLRLKGIVRPVDINASNTVSSTRIADAQIQYSGDGEINDANSMGWLAKLFNSSWMPF